MANRYLPDAGFLPSRHQLILSPTSGDEGPHLLDVLAEVRGAFRQHWSLARLRSSRNFETDVPEDHFRSSRIEFAIVIVVIEIEIHATETRRNDHAILARISPLAITCLT